jgi:hypothetical protein
MWTTRTVIAALPLIGAITLSADTSRPELRALAELNDCIQQRFMTVDKLFGYTRIATPMSPHRFLPETMKETEAVKTLEEARMDVVVYLAGRRVLRARTADTEWSGPKGPLQIANGSGQPLSAPAALDLWDESRDALLAFTTGRSYEFASRVDGWAMIARPVRASGDECLKCHTSLRSGDPIGVVVYAYRGVSAAGR